MSSRRRFLLSLVTLSFFLSLLVLGQRWRRHRDVGRAGVPEWNIAEPFQKDVFTFARVRYSSFWRDWAWRTDYPTSDLNFSWRLQELTALSVDPDGVILDLTDPRIFDYPFLYMIEVGGLVFSEEEVEDLRLYLENGGFLMVDDFWGEEEYANFEEEIRRIFPERPIIELTEDHEIFRMVFELDEKPQIPSINVAWRGRHWGITWEREDAREPHYRAIYDEEGRMMVIICHNTDLGDGWEREGEDPWYFREFSEKKAYPMGINILLYALTH